MLENVIIIGGGPAGLSAAIYLARANLKPLVFAGSPPGGQLMLTSEVENYPGYESILGAELIQKMRNQAIKLGARVVDENVRLVEFTHRPFEIVGANFNSPETSGRFKESPLQTKSVIIATGAKALWLGVPGEERLRGKGVSACATCDGFFFRNKTVAVVGGGDTALEEALTLTKFAEKIYLIHRRDSFRASKIMQERVLNHPKIEVVWNTQVEDIIGENHVEAIKLQVNSPKILSRLNSSPDGTVGVVKQKVVQKFGSLTQKNQIIFPIDGIFVAIGHKPDTELFKGQVELDERGYVKILERRLTSVPGVFVAGDCADSYYRQAVTAAGTGVEAALDVEGWLN